MGIDSTRSPPVMEGQPGRLPALVRSEMAPQGVAIDTSAFRHLECAGVGSPSGLLNRSGLRARGSMPPHSAASVVQRQGNRLVSDKSRVSTGWRLHLWAGKADGFGMQTVNLFLSREWVGTTPAHHALFVQWQDGRPISGQSWFDPTTEHQSRTGGLLVEAGAF